MRTLNVSRVSKLARLAGELVKHRSIEAPSIAAKAMLARTLYGIDVSRFLMAGLYTQRKAQWADSVGYLPELEPGLRTLNWQGDGKRLTVDKLVMAERLAAAHLPAARIIAVVGRYPVFHSARELSEVLALAPPRLFVKPATGWRGDGIFGPERRDGRWQLDAHSFSDDELAARLLTTAPPSGLLVQERLCSHGALAPIGGRLGLGTIRINTALTVDGPEVIFVFGKIMGSECLVDNFAGGKFGNMLARIDAQTGRLVRVFGRRSGQRYLMETVAVHPVTGTPLPDYQLPLWQDAVSLAKRAAIAFPEAPLLGADMALTDDGPVIIEMQSDWDSNAPQLILNRGLRPLLRDVVPRLAASRGVRERAFAQMGLGERTRRKPRRALRAARA